MTIVEQSIFELVTKAKRFAKVELINAGIGVAVFGIIFLLFFPWGKRLYAGDSLVWMVGPPLVFFVMDTLAAVLLMISMRNELNPKKCYLWMLLQVINLFLLTVMGYYVVNAIYNHEYIIYLKLTAALIVLYGYKSLRMYIMHILINDMKARCQQASSEAQQRQNQHVTKY